jgi:hypothetical protein
MTGTATPLLDVENVRLRPALLMPWVGVSRIGWPSTRMAPVSTW